MIKINLKPSAAQESAFLGGIDINLINFKFLIIAIVLITIPQCVFESVTSSQIEKINVQAQEIQQEIAQLTKKEQELKEIQEKMDELKAKEKAVMARLEIIQEVVSVRKNPMKILHELALAIPSDVWLEEIFYEGDKIIFKGNAIDYKSIGIFIEGLNRIVFFNRQVNLDDYSTVTLPESKRRVERFQVTAKIERYE